MDGLPYLERHIRARDDRGSLPTARLCVFIINPAQVGCAIAPSRGPGLTVNHSCLPAYYVYAYELYPFPFERADALRRPRRIVSFTSTPTSIASRTAVRMLCSKAKNCAGSCDCTLCALRSVGTPWRADRVWPWTKIDEQDLCILRCKIGAVPYEVMGLLFAIWTLIFMEAAPYHKHGRTSGRYLCQSDGVPVGVESVEVESSGSYCG